MNYEVTVTREDGLWVADISGEDLGPAATDVERFADLDTEVRDLIAGLTEISPDDFGLTWRYVIGGQDVTDLIDRVVLAEGEFREAAQARDAARTSALGALAKAGLAQSAIGDVLGISHQRVHQLLKAS